MEESETQPIRIGYKLGGTRATRPDITVVGGKAGFAGTKEPLTTEQKDTFRYVIKQLKPSEIHHRNLQGSDEDVDIGIKLSGARIDLVAYDDGPLPDRSKAVVEKTDYLIAAPKYMYKNPGGLWFMVNYARSLKKPRVIIWPDGSVDYYDVPGVQRSGSRALRF